MKKSMMCMLLIIVLIAGSAGADLGWEGTAVIGRRGAFPPEGFWAASNSFPRNGVVTVTNLETGRSVDVIVAMRVSEPGVFLSLSDEAGEQLGMDPTVPARVRAVPVASMPTGPVIAPIATPMKRPFSADPDLNRATAVTPHTRVEPIFADPASPGIAAVPPSADGPGATPAPVPAPEARSGIAQGVFRTAGVIPAPEPPDAEPVGEILLRPPEDDPVVSEPAVPVDPRLAQRPVFAAAPVAANRMEEAVASVRGRTPSVDLFPPPRGDEVFTFLDVPRELTIARPIDRRIAEAGLPGDGPVRIADRPAAELLGRVEEPRRPLMVELPAPASPATAPERVTVDEWALASLPITERLEPSWWYLQIGAFSSPRSARNAIDRLESGFPYTVTPVSVADRTVFRVFVGPIEQDETGVVLRELRARGHRDAFVRRGGA